MSQPMEVERGSTGEKRKQTEMGEGKPDTESPGVSSTQPLQLENLMKVMMESRKESETNFKGLKQEMHKLWSDTNELKGIASQAAVSAEEAKTAVQSLETRVEALEKGKPRNLDPWAQALPPKPQNASASASSSDWQFLGGDEGDTVVIGGYKHWVSYQHRKDALAHIEAQLPVELWDRVRDSTITTGRGKILLLHLKRESEGPTATGRKMLEFCKLFRETQIPIPAIDDRASPGTFYAMPSKPPALREKDAKNALVVATLKDLIPTALADKIEIEMGKGRVFIQDTLVVHKPPGQDKIQIRHEALKKHCPEITPEAFATHLKTIEERREAERNAQ